MFAKIKLYLYALAAFAFSTILLLARGRVLKNQRDSARDALDYYRAKATRARVIAEKDNEIEEQTRSRRTDALKEIKDTGRADIFADPNKLRDDKD